jgi:hypothetical protein
MIKARRRHQGAEMLPPAGNEAWLVPGPYPYHLTTLQAVAVADGDTISSVTSAAYTINLPAAAEPVFSLASGTYTGSQNVTLSDSTTGANIYYTTNGTAPTANSTFYSGAITVSASETIEAFAAASGYANSSVASSTYTIIQPAPTFIFAASPHRRHR